jgi:predicted Rossmann fold flavoprotein
MGRVHDAAGLAILGGGAAGLIAALRAAEAGAKNVVVLEAAPQAGRKILVSGGGRCNVLPMAEARERFVSAAPARLVGRFLARVPLERQRAFFEELLGGPLREERETGKLFPPTNRAKDVRDALVARMLAAGATLRTGAAVREVARTGDGFTLRLADGRELAARRVLLATGGLSVLGGGADGGGLAWAAALGHTIVSTYPALVPLTGDAPSHHALSGVSVSARVEARASGVRAASAGGFLFTHRGWSGPAVLDVSHVVARAAGAADVRAGFGEDWDARLVAGARSGASLSSFLRKSSSSLPDRLIQLILDEAGVADQPLARLPRDARRRVAETLAAFPLPATGTEGYRTAEVTGGGVALDEVDPGSGRSKVVPGLWLAGEILDAFGPIGGFNFQWAWGTGETAGLSAARP